MVLGLMILHPFSMLAHKFFIAPTTLFLWLRLWNAWIYIILYRHTKIANYVYYLVIDYFSEML